MMPYCTYRAVGGQANASLTKGNFYCTGNRSELSPVGLDFVLYIIFLQKSTRCLAQLPNSGPVLNNWLMSGR